MEKGEAIKAKGEPSQDWIEDCNHWHGKVLTGQFGHWCPEWDHLPIDETCEEFKCCCSCFHDDPEYQEYLKHLKL